MQNVKILVQDILSLPPEQRTAEEMILMKRRFAKEQKSADLPTNMQMLNTYREMLQQGEITKQQRFETLLKKRSIRSESGIVPIQVLTKPFWCPGKCIFCPNDATMPKSYINTQPGAMRALLNQFDPYKQAYNRLLSLTLTGHATDKIEMIVLGGTWDVYPKKYKTRFIKGLYDACNSFDQFMEQIDIDFTAAKAARYTPLEHMQLDYPETIEESLRINEAASHRIIGLTIETRPEYVTDVNCKYRRSMGITRLEMGVQSLDDTVLDMNKRGHGTKEIFAAMHKLRQYGFKFSTHLMPGLYGSNEEKDIETFQIAYSTPRVKPDEIKFYPTAVIPNTELYDLYKSGEYKPLTADILERIIRVAKTQIIPPYTRIKRLARDFDTNEVVAGANTPNLRQLVMNEMEKEFDADEHKRAEQYSRLEASDLPTRDTLQLDEQSTHAPVHHVADAAALLKLLSTPLHPLTTTATSSGGLTYLADARYETIMLGWTFDLKAQREFICLCTRCREIRNAEPWEDSARSHKRSLAAKQAAVSASQDTGQAQVHPETHLPFLVIRRYRSSVGEECFISYEDTLGYLYGFTRLLLPDYGQSVDREGLGEWTALIRELHVYGQVAKITSRTDNASLTAEDDTINNNSEKTQHKGIGWLLMQTAEQIAGQARGYKRLSVISGIGVRGYYKKLWYTLDGTYMVKFL